jgi:hypothetical protein
MGEEVPFWRIVKNDYLALLFLLFTPAAAVGFAVEGRPFPLGGRDWAYSIAALIGVACFAFLWRRVGAIRETLRTGQRIPAKVASVWFHEDRGGLEFEYNYAGTRRAAVAINKNADTEKLYVGREIDLMVRPERPDQPVVLGLYSRDGFRPPS